MTDNVNGPLEPTRKMVNAGASACEYEISPAKIKATYRAMLAAAPRAKPVSDPYKLDGGDWYSAESIDALVREIDVALNGANAAPQAKLCDLVKQIKELARPEALKVKREPVGEIGKVIGFGGNYVDAVWSDKMPPIGTKLYTHPAPASDELLGALEKLVHDWHEDELTTVDVFNGIDALIAKYKGPQS